MMGEMFFKPLASGSLERSVTGRSWMRCALPVVLLTAALHAAASVAVAQQAPDSAAVADPNAAAQRSEQSANGAAAAGEARSTAAVGVDVEQPAAPTPLDLQAYRVEISIAFSGDSRVTSQFRDEVRGELASCIHRVMGRMWEPVITSEGGASWGNIEALNRLTSQDFLAQPLDQEFDKAILLYVGVEGNRYVIGARQWDLKTQELGPLRMRETLDRRMVAADAFSVVHMVFQPVGEVVDVSDEGQVTMLLKAGELFPSDPDVAQVVPGSLLHPYFRYLDRDLKLRQIQAVPWTYLKVDATDVSIVHCTPVSGIATPITKSRRRVEVVATRIQADLDETVLKLVPFRSPNKPLVGHYVEVTTQRKPDEAAGGHLELLSGRTGEVTIPRNPEHPLLWIRVRSGNSTLARVPFVPGVEPHRVMELPDDSERLRVEGQVATLQGELIDTVARRAILLSLVRSLSESGDWKNFDEQMAALQKLPETRYFESKLTAIRVPAVESAQKRRDRSAESRVNRLCDQAAELIKRYLDPRELQLIKEEIRELLSRRAKAGNAAST